jgi:tetratricopeptide (TPR) repeat protein
VLGDPEAAEVVASRLSPCSGLITCNGSATRGPADYGLGLLALTQGRIDDAAKLLSAALDQAQRCRMAVSEAQILVALAALAHEQGDLTTAEEHARAALVICNERGLAGIEAEACTLLPARAT